MASYETELKIIKAMSINTLSNIDDSELSTEEVARKWMTEQYQHWLATKRAEETENEADTMIIEQVEQTLINAGFIVTLSGMSFVVSLSNRSVNTMDVLAALNYTSNVSCMRSDRSVVVFVD